MEKIDPVLVYHNSKGQAESVRYEMVNAMLLNEFLKEHHRGEEQDCKIQEQETTIAELRSEIRNLAAMVNDQALELRKVNAELQISKPLHKRLRVIGRNVVAGIVDAGS